MNDTRLRNKMLLVYFLCIFIPMIITNTIFYNTISDNVRDRRVRDIDRAVEQIRNDFRTHIGEAVELSAFFYADYNTNDALERAYGSEAEFLDAYDQYLWPVLNNYSSISNTLQNITIYVDNPTMLHSGNIGWLSEELKQTSWYSSSMLDSRSYPAFTRMETDGEFDYFSLVRRLDYYARRMHYEKLLKIDFKMIDLMEVFTTLNIPGDLYLINPEGQIEYTTNPDINWRESLVPYAVESKDIIEFKKDFGEISHLSGWTIAATVHDTEVIEEVRKSRGFILWSACLMIVVSTVIILLIVRSINTRVVKVLKHMKKVKNQNFEMISGEESSDEIGQLTVEFNHMIMQIKTLIDDVYVAEIRAKSLELERRKAQWNALQSQINPHFLFNALETIRMRSLLKKETETAKMIQSMAKVFRSSLTWNEDQIPVEKELEFVKCFLDIQQYRFEEKLEYTLDVSPEALVCKVPKMIFLPFVENSCIHGIETLAEDGRIDIRIAVIGNELVFTVSDNGGGMRQEVVDMLYRYLESDDMMGERIGVQNVIYRARMIYGDKFGFDVNSRLGEGTQITLTLPANELL